MRKTTGIMALVAVLLVSGAFAQLDDVTGDFKRGMGYGMMDGARDYQDGRRSMSLGFCVLFGLAAVGLILLIWLHVIKLYREVLKKR